MSAYLIRPDATIPPPAEEVPLHPYTFPLDPFQQHALIAIANEHNVLVCAKTGSGKTLVGEYQIHHSLAKGKRVFYTTPIKSLSNQKFHDLKTMFPSARIGIMTGDIKFCPDAQVVIMTTEILRNLLYKRGTATEHLGLTASLSMDDVDAVIFDECHYINDRDRGAVWEETMILLPRTVRMILLSATLDHPEFLAEWLGECKQTPIHLLETLHRVVPLSHYVLSATGKDAEAFRMECVMDAKETYYEQTYTAWLRGREKQAAAEWEHQCAVQVAKRDEGRKGGVDGKTRVASFLHHFNAVIGYLEEKELLPALCFVLSRKQCEAYAERMERTLLDVADASAVKHIIGFHLHRYQAQLDTNPQYHRLVDLLTRGIAFHHSGLSPLLKEIIEILFSKGYVKLLFCTETFAVGLNMPTKTVIFAGLKKYDEDLDGMRLLRNDEYFQMAGRAGRRGKDDKGVVIYVPDQDPIQPYDLFRILKGARPPVMSRMNFHYEFLLKSLQSTPEADAGSGGGWLRVMNQSYWLRQREADRDQQATVVAEVEAQWKAMQVTDPVYQKGCQDRARYEHLVRVTVNAQRKEAQRQLDSVKNKQMGPKWAAAWASYQLSVQLEKKYNEERALLEELQEPQHTVEPALRILYQLGYLTRPDADSRADLTLKGILATEVNEAHPILLTEMYTAGHLKGQTGTELVQLLSAFLEQKASDGAPPHTPALPTFRIMEQLATDCMVVEIKEECFHNDDWGLSTFWMDPMRDWVEGAASMTELCTKYDLFEGNFIRAVMKMVNMLDEVMAMATYCQHTDVVDMLLEVKPRMIRDLVLSDSLYLRL